MGKRRPPIWTTLLIAVIMLAGCAPRVGSGGAAVEQPDHLVVDLPAVVVDVAPDGEVRVGRVPVAQLASLAGLTPSARAIPAAVVDFMTRSNIQHIQISNTRDRLLILVNGKSIPAPAWDGESLATTAELFSTFGGTVYPLDQVLPLIDQVGIGLVVNFPVAEGQAAVPLHSDEDEDAAVLAEQQQQFLAAVGQAPRINLPVFYRADGSWTAGDLTSAEWTALTGLPFYALNLPPALLDRLAAAGVDQVSISTDPEGIRIGVNGNRLPTLTWGNGELSNLLELVGGVAEQHGLLDRPATHMNRRDLLATVQELMPIVTTVDFDLTVHLPASGAAAIR